VLATKLEFAIADTTSAERHPTKLAIEPVAEHRLFFFVRQGHPLVASKTHSLETILVFPLVAPRLPQRIGSHITQSVPQARIDRETGDHLPNLMLDSFAVARNLVSAGDAVGLAPLVALEDDIRARKLELIPFSAPWLHLNYGLFYPRKRALSRVAQLFMTQLRQVEATIQAREQRALSRLEDRQGGRRTASKGSTSRSAAKSSSKSAGSSAPRAKRSRK
jgi:DNA-binding transcriptional LysR family regulator